MDEHNRVPLVTIAIPAYNRPEYLPALIECWLGQTYSNFELIISNDASPDPRVHEICEKYTAQDARVRYIKQEKNLGVLPSFKLLLNEARGKYFIWAENDDLWDTRFLHECTNKFNEEPDLTMVFGRMIDIDKNGNEFKEYDPAHYVPTEKGAYERLKTFLRFRFSDGKNQLILGLWKREKILDDPLFGLRAKDDRSPWYWGFDNFFTFRNLTKGPFGFAPQARFFRRSVRNEEPNLLRFFPFRIAVTAYERLKKIFGSPYFYYVEHVIVTTKALTLPEKLKLLLWNCSVAGRLFFSRKI